jgi:hypothetical protein
VEFVVSEVRCPKCGAGEMHPDGDKLLIRGFKVYADRHWWSQCLVCAGYYDENLKVKPVGSNGRDPDYDRSAGWF